MSSSADDILERVSVAFAGCASYRDEGVVTRTFFNHTRRIQQLPFSTRFVRDVGFQFEFRSRRGEDDWDQYAVWTEGGRPRTWWSAYPVQTDPESLALALAGASGISGGSAYRVPHLLMPELRLTRSPYWPPDPKLVDVPEASLQGCMVVEFSRGTGGVQQLWIEESSSLIRRVVEPRRTLGPPPPEAIEIVKARFPDGGSKVLVGFVEAAARAPVEVESVTTYEAAFDATCARDELVFVPNANGL